MSCSYLSLSALSETGSQVVNLDQTREIGGDELYL